MTIFHVAIADDWEASLPFGSYEASTHGRSLDDEGFIHATTAAGIQKVLDGYAQIRMPLLLIALEPSALGVEVRWDAAERPRILGPIPCTDPDAVQSVIRLERRDGEWIPPIETVSS